MGDQKIPEPFGESEHCRIWFGLDEPIYRHQIEGISQSTLKHALRSPAHLRHAIEGPSLTTTPAMLKGTVAHCFTLQPSLSWQFERAPDGYTGTKKADDALTEAKAKDGITLVKQDLYDDALAIARAIEEHPVASSLLGEYDGTPDWEITSEVSMQWNHFTDRSVTLKGRIDRLVLGDGFLRLVDLKTTADIKSWAKKARWEAPEFFFQSALYLQGIHETKPLIDAVGYDLEWYWIVAESSPPYDVQVFRLTDNVLDCGNRAVAEAVKVYRTCLDTGVWPGSKPEVLDFGFLDDSQLFVPSVLKEPQFS